MFEAKSNPTADEGHKAQRRSEGLAGARAAFLAAAADLDAAKGRAAGFRERRGDLTDQINRLRAAEVEAEGAAKAALEAFVLGGGTDAQWLEAHARVEGLAKERAALEELSSRLARADEPNLARLYTARNDARDWLVMTLIEERLGADLRRLRPAMMETFAAWLWGPAKGRIGYGNQQARDRLWGEFWSSLTAPPQRDELNAAREVLAESLDLGDLGPPVMKPDPSCGTPKR